MLADTEVKIIDRLTRLEVATLTAAVVKNAKRAFSLREVLQIRNDLMFALEPRPGLGAYDAWVKTHDAALDKVHN